jgi:CspA family cold shock protein
MEAVLSSGVVDWFSAKKGYGFIKVDGAEPFDVFVHFSAINQDGYKELTQGDVVSFGITEDGRGRNKKQAVDVTVVKSAKKTFTRNKRVTNAREVVGDKK